MKKKFSEDKLRVLYLAPKRKGGPHILLKDLADFLNLREDISIDFYASFYGFLKGIFSKKYDLIHTILPIPFNIWGTPVVLNIHGDYKKERSFRNILGFLYPISILFSKKIVVPSIFLKNVLNLKKCEIIGNFVKIDTCNLINKKYSRGLIRISTLTGFKFWEKSRGILDLIKILSTLNVETKICLDIFGDGIYRKKIEDLVYKINLRNNISINFLGFVNKPQDKLNEYDIFVYYSYLDNFPIALLEAMRAGLPIISNEVGSVKDFIPSNCGFITNSNEKYSLFLKELIINKDLRNSMGLNGIELVSTKYSLEIIGESFMKVYKNIYK